MSGDARKRLLSMSIIMIVVSALGLFSTVLALLGVGLISGVLISLPVGIGVTGLLSITAVLVNLTSTLMLVAGILGVKNAFLAGPKTACLIFGVLTLVLGLIAGALNGGIYRVLTGIVVPLLYVISAVQVERLPGNS